MIKKFGFLAVMSIGAFSFAQTNPHRGNTGINTTTPRSTLDIHPNVDNAKTEATTNEGILAPRLSKTRISNIANPIEGTLLYATDEAGSPISAYTGNNAKVAKITEKGYYFYNGTEWVKVQNKERGSRWINDTGNKIVKLDTYSDGLTERSELNNIRITDDGKFFLGRNHNMDIDPNAKFQIEGAVKATGVGIISGSNVGPSISLYNPLKEDDSQAYKWTIYNMTSTTSDSGYKNALVFWNYNKNNVSSVTNKPQFFILDNGNVSIGGSPYLNSPDLTDKLTVHGTIKTTSLAGGTLSRPVYVTSTGVLTTDITEAGAISLSGKSELPCNEANRGKMNFVKDVTIGSGTGDAFAVCLKGTDGKFYWRYLYGAAGMSNLEGNFGTGLQ